MFPVAEPFGKWLNYKFKNQSGLSDQEKEELEESYCYYDLYRKTKTSAKQNAEKDKFILTGEYQATANNEISLGCMYVPQGSVTVTAGGVTLTEGTDYSVDYTSGIVTILNQSIIDAGTNINVSMENNEAYTAMSRKTMFGLNWEYDFSKDFQHLLL